MRQRWFCPAMVDRLEDRVVLTGHQAVVLTTNAYNKAENSINATVQRFIASPQGTQELLSLGVSLQKSSKGIPYGRKSLFPAPLSTVNNFKNAGRLDGLQAALDDVLYNYVKTNSDRGLIRVKPSTGSFPMMPPPF